MKGVDAREAQIEALYRERFRAFALGATALLQDGEAALDVVQEAFAIALRRRGSFRGDGTLEAWLWRIVINVAHDRRRARRRESRPLPVVRTLASDGDSPDDLTELLLALPERQRLAIFLRYYADLSYAQIAEVLGVSSGTVSASHHNCPRRIATAASGGNTMTEFESVLDELVVDAPVTRASWDDVQKRARRRRRRRLITATLRDIRERWRTRPSPRLHATQARAPGLK